jgi:hypothetical protein
MFKKNKEEREYAKYNRILNRARKKHIKSGLIPKNHEGCFVYMKWDGGVDGVSYTLNGKSTIKLLDGTVLAENVDCAEMEPDFYAYEDPKTGWTGKRYDGSILFKNMDDAHWHEDFVICIKGNQNTIMKYNGSIIAKYDDSRDGELHNFFFDKFFIYKDNGRIIIKDNTGKNIKSVGILWDMIERSRKKDKVKVLRELIGDKEK